MKTHNNNRSESRREIAEVRAMLREIGHVLWLSKQMAAEIRKEASQPIRPEMSEYCAVDTFTVSA